MATTGTAAPGGLFERLLPPPVRSSSLALLAANLLPLWGVVVLDWPVFEVMALYWAENVVAGVFTLLRLVVANPLAGLPLGLFFCVHYGMFCFVHGVFVYTMFNRADIGLGVFELVHELLSTPSLLLGVWLMGVSHGWSFVVHALRTGPRQADTATLHRIMMRPYGRMVILHATILFGGFMTMKVGAPLSALLVLIGLKTAVDLLLHCRANLAAGAGA